MQPPLDVSMAVAGAILHDIGKLRELEQQPDGAVYTASGALIGHLLQGRDIVREAAAACPIAGRYAACGWSTSSSRISDCPNGARPSRR